MTDLTPETVAALRGRAGVSDRLSLSREQVLALLDAADERDRLVAKVEREPVEETVCPRCVCPRCFLRRSLSGDDCGCDS